MIYILNKDNKQIATHNMKFEEYFISLSQFLEEPKKYFSDWKEGYIATLYPPKSLEEVKEITRLKFKNERDNKIEENISINDIEIQVRMADRENIKEAIEFSEKLGIEKTKWILADNSTCEMTAEMLQLYLTHYTIRKLQIFEMYGNIIEQIAIAENVEELNKITWEV